MSLWARARGTCTIVNQVVAEASLGLRICPGWFVAIRSIRNRDFVWAIGLGGGPDRKSSRLAGGTKLPRRAVDIEDKKVTYNRNLYDFCVVGSDMSQLLDRPWIASFLQSGGGLAVAMVQPVTISHFIKKRERWRK
jgi:hypothetical protein